MNQGKDTEPWGSKGGVGGMRQAKVEERERIMSNSWQSHFLGHLMEGTDVTG